MKRTFENQLYDIKVLFDYGEANAIALAATLGIAALVTDDTKENGPHYSLEREYIDDVIPFAFYELLFLRYLKSNNDIDAFSNDFKRICEISFEHSMGFKNRIGRVVRRFSSKGSERDQKWMKEFCIKGGIEYTEKMKHLSALLKKIE